MAAGCACGDTFFVVEKKIRILLGIAFIIMRRRARKKNLVSMDFDQDI